MHRIALTLTAVTSMTAFAAAPNIGPWSRKPTDEKKIKAELKAFFDKENELQLKGDMEGMTALLDFPLYLATDDQTGAFEGEVLSKEAFFAKMKPFQAALPKDRKLTHDLSYHVLSDTMAVAYDEITVTTGGQKLVGRHATLLVKKNGEWKRKTLMEPGWAGAPPAAPKT